MLSISTTWNAQKVKSAEKIVDQIGSLDTKNIELSSNLSKNSFKNILRVARSRKFKITSMHNYCPVPDGYAAAAFSSDFFSLADPDNKRRKLAVEFTVGSLKNAAAAKAKALIVHAGRVEMPQRTKDLIRLFKRDKAHTKECRVLLSDILKERKTKKIPYLRSLMLSLKELLRASVGLKVAICLENRFYIREIPDYAELGLIFERFKSAKNLYYWHDCGHAQVRENLGLEQHLEYLNAFGSRLRGIHLHDVCGPYDHLPPGEGTIDFDSLKPFLKKNTIKVLEIHQPAKAANISRSIAFLKSKGIS